MARKKRDNPWDLFLRKFPREVANFATFQSAFGYQFNNPHLFYEAVTHKSAMSVTDTLSFNERLEFLGDSVLGLSATTFLWDQVEGCAQEGVLSRFRAALVSEEALFYIGKNLGLFPCLLLGKTVRHNHKINQASLVADAFEAIIGAMFLDSDFETARSVLQVHLSRYFNEQLEMQQFDFKTQLQELIQAHLKVTPTYRDMSAEGPDHNRTFKVAVEVNQKKVAIGEGSSKKRASQDAARNALGILKDTEESTLISKLHGE